MNEKKSLILIVEDEEQVLNTNCRMLRRRGYDVRTAQTAAEACHQLEEQLPDLLILDIMLPDGNGLDICRRFREKTMNPVLFLTGKSDIRDRVEGLQQGGDYYLTKPYNFDEFLAVIQMLLERQKRMEEKIKEKFQSSRQITIGSLRLDLSDGHAYLNNADTGLTRTEFSLLRLLAENQEKIFLQKSSTKRYGAAVQEQIPARYGGISLTSGPRSVPKIPMSMTLSRFMGRDIFLPADKPAFSRSDNIFPDLYAAFRKCLFFFTFPDIGICLLQCT